MKELFKELGKKAWAFFTVWTEEQMAAHLNKTGRWDVKKK